MEAIEALIFMSIVVEFLVAIFKKLVTDKYSQLVSMGFGILLCLTYRVGVFSAVGLVTELPVIDYILSGLIISRGSNALYDLFGRNKKDSGERK